MEDFPTLAFERHVKKLLNQVTVETMVSTVQNIADHMLRSDVPAAYRIVAQLIADSLSQRGSLNLHVNMLGQLVCSLDAHLGRQLLTHDIKFGTTVVDAYWERLQKVLTAAAPDERTERSDGVASWPFHPLSREMQLRRSLVNFCKFVPSLFHGGLFDEDAVSLLLKRLAVNAGSGCNSLEASSSHVPDSSDSCTIVTMMSGAVPSVQPSSGETDFAYRCRLGSELGLPPDRLALVANGAELTSTEVKLDSLSGIPVTAIVRPGALKPEHLVEAACALLNDLNGDLRVTETGAVLADQALFDLVRLKPDLPKRVQFMILDLEEAAAKNAVAETAENATTSAECS
mmetsp:Transcript_49442/g.92516  ORF Transcript_49442/g.92516 Transcript_49442/m.92516 type:complete len:344 (-) Transcript_49442:57-1088(-)